MYMKRVATGVGGSYTEWQRKPPAHAVYMAESGDGWTTVTVWYERGEVVRMSDGAMGPKSTPFAHDVYVEDMAPDARDAFVEYIHRDIAERHSDAG